MSSPLEELEAAALALPRAERARLVLYLLDSLDENDEVEQAWFQEIAERLQAYRDQDARTYEARDVLTTARANLER